MSTAGPPPGVSDTMTTLVTGVDSSTQSCKVLTVDAETGRIAHQGHAPHPEGTAVDPEHWWKALESAAGPDLMRTQALAVAAQQHGMVALDADNRPVHDALLWNDTRSAPQADRLRARFGPEHWARGMGVVPVASFTVTKLAWLAENHPELAARVERVILPHDWLSWKLRGMLGDPVTDRSDASGTGYFSVPENRYRTAELAHAFGRVPELPRVLGPAEAAGTTAWGTLMAPGCGDNAGAALGLGLRPGEVVVSIGTSCTVFTSAPRPVIDPTGAIAGFADAQGASLPLLATLNGARVMSTTADLLGVDLARLDHLASSAARDADGLIFVPYLDGERTPNLPFASGSLAGVTRRSLTPENLARAAVLGVLNGLAEALNAFRGQGIPVHRVLLIGGGARSESLRRAAPDMLDAEVVVPAPREYVALGAARQAAWTLAGTQEPPQWEREMDAVYRQTDAPAWAGTVHEQFLELRNHHYGL